MVVNRTGVTRIVFIFKQVVVKIPNFSYSWQHFLKGLLANIQENTCYKWSGNKELLCPVIWASWGGWVLVMKRADIKRHEDEIRALPFTIQDPEEQVKERYKEWINAGLGGDDKCDNYGYINNRLVKVDYAQ